MQTLTTTLALQRAAYLAAPEPSLAQRRADLETLERFIRDHTDALCDAISQDYGHRSVHESKLTEVFPVLDGLKSAKKNLKRWASPQKRKIDRLTFGLANNVVIPQPLGVVGVIVPWNFPVNLTFVPLTYIFAAGNRAMVKMSENSRHLAALLIAKMPAYFPPEKLQFFDETGGVGVEFSKLPFDHLLFTGSGATGRSVMAAAAQNLCPVTLELGGKAPAIVLEDYPVKLAAERISYVKYLNAGQICTTVDHVWVHQSKVQAFIDEVRTLVPQRYADIHSVDLTSMINAGPYERLLAAIDDAKARGATVECLLPGEAFDAAKHRIAPHIVINPPLDSIMMTREIFGPILPILTYEKLEDVVAHINAGDRPLALYPFSYDKNKLNYLLTHVMSGGVTVNDALFHVAQNDMPFGGVGASGMGHYHGKEGFDTFSKLRPVFYQSKFTAMKFLMPPYGKGIERMMKIMMR